MPHRRKGLQLALAAALLGFLLGGCAERVAKRAPPGPASATATAAKPAASAQGATPPAVAARDATDPSSRPHQQPKSQADLWSSVRAGVALDSHAGRYSVRRWTQLYATHQGDLDAALERAKPFLWHVVNGVKQRDLPSEVALLPIVESGYDPTARSYVGAIGLWQFMPGTADHMGLSRDWWYDGRKDVIASTAAALDYLEQLARRYDGDWLLAFAAYNAGPGRVDAARRRARREGIEPIYWNLELPRETTEYVPKLLALRRIMMTPAEFGVDWPVLSMRPRTRVVVIPQQIELAVAADMMAISEARLRRLNPGMRRWASAPDGTHRLLVPAEKAAAFAKAVAAADPAMLVQRQTYTVRRGDVLGRIARHHGVSLAALRQANHLRGDRIVAGQRLDIPRGRGSDGPTPAEPAETYTVQSGDTLWDIAHRYNISLVTLKRANRSTGRHLRPGQSLVLPGAALPPEPSTYVVKNGDSLWSIAQANDIATTNLRRWNRLGHEQPLQPGSTLAVDGPAPLPDYYEVEAGDSLWSIADRFSMQVTTLRSLNEMASGSTIRPGQRLRLQPAASSG